MTEPDSQKDIIEEGKSHLTDARRSAFEAKGYDIVEQEMLTDHFNREKNLAAIVWLAEKRGERKTKKTAGSGYP